MNSQSTLSHTTLTMLLQVRAKPPMTNAVAANAPPPPPPPSPDACKLLPLQVHAGGSEGRGDEVAAVIGRCELHLGWLMSPGRKRRRQTRTFVHKRLELLDPRSNGRVVGFIQVALSFSPDPEEERVWPALHSFASGDSAAAAKRRGGGAGGALMVRVVGARGVTGSQQAGDRAALKPIVAMRSLLSSQRGGSGVGSSSPSALVERRWEADMMATSVTHL